jgi:hypothetical protein
MNMKVGDLLHIPQAVVLWTTDTAGDLEGSAQTPYIQTEKPCTGIYLGAAKALDQNHLINVFVKGQQRFVHSKDVYPLGE